MNEILLSFAECIARGHRAQSFIDSEEYRLAIENTVKILAYHWVDTDAGDVEEREQIYRQLTALVAVDQQLSLLVEDGQLAEAAQRENEDA